LLPDFWLVLLRDRSKPHHLYVFINKDRQDRSRNRNPPGKRPITSGLRPPVLAKIKAVRGKPMNLSETQLGSAGRNGNELREDCGDGSQDRNQQEQLQWHLQF
jgi:hypothetical protein